MLSSLSSHSVLHSCPNATPKGQPSDCKCSSGVSWGQRWTHEEKVLRFTHWLLHDISLPAPDELKHIIGADTTRKGILRVFDMFQYQPMNRRLVYVFLEGFLETMFPQYKFPELFVKLHSRSPRIHRYSQKLKSSSLKRWQERTEATGPISHTQTWELTVRAVGLGTWCEHWGMCVRDFCPSTSLAHTFWWKHSSYSAEYFLSKQNWRMNNTPSTLPRSMIHTYANTSPVIYTNTQHGSLFFLVSIFHPSLLDILLVLSLILGQSLLLSCGPESRPQILYCF